MVRPHHCADLVQPDQSGSRTPSSQRHRCSIPASLSHAIQLIVPHPDVLQHSLARPSSQWTCSCLPCLVSSHQDLNTQRSHSSLAEQLCRPRCRLVATATLRSDVWPPLVLHVTSMAHVNRYPLSVTVHSRNSSSSLVAPSLRPPLGSEVMAKIQLDSSIAIALRPLVSELRVVLSSLTFSFCRRRASRLTFLSLSSWACHFALDIVNTTMALHGSQCRVLLLKKLQPSLSVHSLGSAIDLWVHIVYSDCFPLLPAAQIRAGTLVARPTSLRQTSSTVVSHQTAASRSSITT